MAAVALAARAVVAMHGPSPPETFEYDVIARNLLSGSGLTYEHLGTTYWSYYSGVPYILLTAVLYALFPPGLNAVLVAQAAVAALCAAVISSLAARLLGNAGGMLAGLLVALHPALIYYDARKLHPLGFDALLACASVTLLLRASRDSRPAIAASAGLVLGAAILQRGSLLPFLAIGTIRLARIDRARGATRVAAAFAAGALLALAPWMLRSAAIHGCPLLVTTTAEHLWIGNIPPSSGSALLPTGELVIETASPEFTRALHHRDELGQQALFRAAVLAHVRDRPGSAAASLARKVLYFWTGSPQAGLWYPQWYYVAYVTFYVPFVACALLGAVQLLRAPAGSEGRAAATLILGLITSVWVVHAVFYVEMRHRWAIEPLLAVLATSAACRATGSAAGLRATRTGS